MITKQVEFGHRGVGSHARAKGPAKPAEFQHVADKYLVNRVAVLHNEACDRPRKSRPKIKSHPRFVEATEEVKKRHSSRSGVGGNPKFQWLNERRCQLKGEGLDKVTFKQRMHEYANQFDQDILTQQAARDRWSADRLHAIAEVGEAPAQRASTGAGPWKLGDDFWPVGEERLRNFVEEHSSRGNRLSLFSKVVARRVRDAGLCGCLLLILAKA